MKRRKGHDNCTMQKLITTDLDNAKIVTWSVRPVLQERANHPYETYLFLFDERGYDTCTMCHKTLAAAKKYHAEMALMMGGSDVAQA